MKAKVKGTGKVIILNEKVSLIDYARGMYRDTEGNKYHCKELEFIEEKVENPIDWEQRRYEIAKAVMQGRLSNQYGDVLVGERDFAGVVASAVEFADALIVELKKGGKR